ncbi:MAG: hypothetical protein KF898_03630 [Parachlamydiales bacterium]|nr:hypothetical protein [Candidatus Acheromyda pituitae]
MNTEQIQGVAVIGIAGRFPGAENITAFWKNICEGKEGISRFSNEELAGSNIPEWQAQASRYVRSRGILKDIEFFDSSFFGIPFIEAQLTDPQQRLFLECAFEALESAGYSSDSYPGSIGVYGGTSRSTYFLHHLLPNSSLMESMGDFLIRTGNEPDFLTTKTSYRLNLKGPSISIQTACSTSLSAICIACNHLLTYQCDIALAGGVSIYSPQQSGYSYQDGMIFSPDGHCRPFDSSAKGTVPSNGVGIVVLKRLEEAIADKDHIYAVIRGYGMNNDGGEKISYAAPSVSGQAAAIESAIAMADLDPATISYVEAHGTATFLGDPIEIEALNRAFRNYTDKKGFCAISSVKSHIGHCMEAAGVMGFINAVFALYEQKIPPLLHFNALNPHINLENSPFYINPKLKEWETITTPRRACVSSFGVGGTNAHLILEEAPNRREAPPSTGPHLLILSAKTPSALKNIAHSLAIHLTDNPTISLADVAYTLQVGRKTFEYKRTIVCQSREEAIALLLESNGLTPFLTTSQEKCLNEIGNSWMKGDVIDWHEIWTHLNGTDQPSRIPLPTYPFEKKRCWIDPPQESEKRKSDLTVNDSINSDSSAEDTLLRIWQQFLGTEKIELDDDFFALGGDSLLGLQVISRIEEELGVTLKLHSLFQYRTISQLTAAINQQNLTNSSLVSLREGSGYPLFLIPGIEGSCLSLKPLADSMSYQGPIYGIELGELVCQKQKIEDIASVLVKEILEISPIGPYLLCGYSFGGILAYEIARQLEQMGHAPSFLGIIDAINPQHPLVPKNDPRELLIFLIELIMAKKVSSSSNLSMPQLQKMLLEGMGMGHLSETFQRKISQLVQQNLKALMSYEPKPYYGNVLFFEAIEQFFRMSNISLSTTWNLAIHGKLTVFQIPGHHSEVLKPSNIELLANQLDLYLLNALDQ